MRALVVIAAMLVVATGCPKSSNDPAAAMARFAECADKGGVVLSAFGGKREPTAERPTLPF